MDELNQESILKLIEKSSSDYISIGSNNNDLAYFHRLFRELDDHYVCQIKPLNIIRIEKGISTNALRLCLTDFFKLIKEYDNLRTNIFGSLLSENGLTFENFQFWMLKEKLEKRSGWPRGNFAQWNYWAHGGDIEFEEDNTKRHFNIQLFNFKSFKAWSVLKYLKQSNFEDLKSSCNMEEKAIQKLLDLGVLEGEFTDHQNELRMKITKRKDDFQTQ